jgi:hypothetical protein
LPDTRKVVSHLLSEHIDVGSDLGRHSKAVHGLQALHNRPQDFTPTDLVGDGRDELRRTVSSASLLDGVAAKRHAQIGR